MAFDFPANPANGAVFTDAVTGIVYNFDGTVWMPGAGAAGANPYVLKAGDTMLGPLNVIHPPSAANHAGSKRYIDETIAAKALYQGVWQVAANTPNLDPTVILPLHAYSWLAQTVDPSVPEVAPAALPGIGGQTISATDTVQWNANLNIYELIRGAAGVSMMLINDTPPTTAIPGQQWWDSNSGKQYVYFDDGNSQAWIQTSGGGGGSRYIVPVSATSPIATEVGELYFNSTDASLYIWYDDGTSAQWVDVSA